jgi:hypothetical protein
MRESSSLTATSGLTRRAVLGILAALASALAAIPFRDPFSQTASCPAGRRAIVSFHMDQPYLDWSGTALPYHPPPGARSAQGVAHLSEEMFRRNSICA